MSAPEIPLYLDPQREAAMERLGYDEAQKALTRQFAERGYVVLDLGAGALADEVIAQVAPFYRGAERTQDAPVPAARALAAEAQALAALRTLYGREPFPFQTLNFCRGTEQETHADTIHFDCRPRGFMAGVWVALEDIDAGNGPLRYFPGSHLLPQMTLADFGHPVFPGIDAAIALYTSAYEPGIRAMVEAKGLAPEQGIIRKGQAIVWAANLLHGGSPIVEPGRSRHSQVTHYYFHGCDYLTPLYSDDRRTYRRWPEDLRTGRYVVRPPLRHRIVNRAQRLWARLRP